MEFGLGIGHALPPQWGDGEGAGENLGPILFCYLGPVFKADLSYVKLVSSVTCVFNNLSYEDLAKRTRTSTHVSTQFSTCVSFAHPLVLNCVDFVQVQIDRKSSVCVKFATCESVWPPTQVLIFQTCVDLGVRLDRNKSVSVT